MLYETPGSRENSFDKDGGPIPTKWGMGAVTPHKANWRSAGTGGGYGVQSVGSGPGNTTGTPLTGSSGSAFRVVGRNTSLIKFGLKGKPEVRGKYQASGIAPRASTKGDDFVAPASPSGASGLGDFFSHFTNIKTYLPPGGKINRVQPLGFISKVLPTPLRTAIRYYGAGMQSVFAPVLSGAQQRRIFGLSPKESGTFMKLQQVMLPIDAVIVTAGTGYVLASGGSPFAYTPSALAQGKAAIDAGVAIGPQLPASAPAWSMVTSPVATPALTPAQMAVSLTKTGIPTADALQEPLAASMGPLSFPAQAPLSMTPAQLAASSGGGFLTKAGDAAYDAGAFVGKTAVTTAATGYLQAMLLPHGQMSPDGTGSSPLSLGYQPPQGFAQPYSGYGASVPSFSGGSVGGDAPQAEQASLMSPTVLVGGAIVTAGIVMLLKKKRKP